MRFGWRKSTAPSSWQPRSPSRKSPRRRAASILWLVCEVEGRVVGYAYASRHHERAAYRWSVNAAVYIEAPSQGKGIGKALYTGLLERVRRLGYFNAYGGITLPNPASVKLHESFGFKPVGVYKKVGFKLGAWHDVGWWELAFPGRPSVPPPPGKLV